MTTYNIHEAKTHFSRLVIEASRGKEVMIARAGTPIARLESITSKRPKFRFGVLKGKVEIAEDFDAPLPGDWMEAFEN